MNQLKKLFTWLSGVALVLGSLIEAVNAFKAASGADFDPASPIGKGLILAGTITLFLRNLLKDENANGWPDIFEQLNPDQQRAVMTQLRERQRGASSLGMLVAMLAVGILAACGPALTNARPGMGLAISADTIAITVGCDADAPNVACLISVVDSATGAVVASDVRVNVGANLDLPPRFCTTNGPVAYFGTFVAVTASGKRAPPATGIGRNTCDLAGGSARPRIIVEIRPGGV